ncbi:Ig-like domain-containing protein [Pseudomonas sp. GD03944]|uniref:Ig-like domain-containing protein n=1 Tax=Pseudomonas sp. GD03944 TaxID=2975409 RepID=UPI002449DC1A|nr:Ig-like domain-containing protein [Pseudomonas sp. GD03944]MDH1263528.1 Ig-like domain-containing protein [Pseudomonas sp. GD03944]
MIGTLPDRPTIDPSNGTTVTGTAGANETVVLTDGAGNVIATVTADPSGDWSYTATPALANASEINAAVRDALGNLSGPATTVVDSVPPPVPSVTPSNGTVLSGTAEAGSTILLTGPGLNVEVVADGNGNWSHTVTGAPLADLTQVTVVARDAVGNESPSATVVIDRAPPADPTIAISNGTVLKGTAEAGATVILTTGVGGQPLATTIADANGNWTFSPLNPLPHGTRVNAQARDALGNPSGVTSINVDGVPPAAPSVAPSKGDLLSGTTEGNAQITLTDASGNVIGQVTANGAGVWSFTPSSALPDGTLVKVTATDPAGNLSAPTTITVDAVPPLAPTLAPTQGDTLTGTAEAGTTVRLTDGNGGLIGQALTDAFGNWTYTPSPALPNGTTVNAVAIDAAGNVSPPVSTVSDDAPPAIPTIAPSNGTLISGAADIGSTVLLTLPDGTVVEVPVDGQGNWSFTPNPALLDGDPVRAAARDVAGNESALSPITVIDTVPPATPTIDSSQGTTLTGTAEPNTDVVITIGSGTPITVTSNGAGDWTYTPTPAVPNGTTVTVVARDPAGNDSPPASTVVDSVVPTVTLEASNGNLLTGVTEAGATVTISGLSNSPVSVIAGPDGRWEYTPIAPPAHNAAISVVAEDAAGNASDPADIVIDRQAPAISLEPSDGSLLRGVTEGGATVVISTGSGTVLATVTADPGGNWTYTPTPPLLHDTAISVTASDALGNTSTPAVGTVDSVAPDAPTIQPSQGVTLQGTAEANSEVTLTFVSQGNPVTVTVIADGPGGAWTYTPQPALPNGTTVSVVATDASGNSSASASTVTDNQPPVSPVVSVSSGQSINGTAEPGSTITFTVNGAPFNAGTVTADANGAWRVDNIGPLSDGDVIRAWATDAAGNTSVLPGTQTVDASLPEPPVINPSRGTVISGTAEANTQVELTINGLSVLVSVDNAGNWSHFPSPFIPDGVQVTAVVIDGSNNTSAPVSTVIDAMPPAVPDALTATATTVTGTGEIGATIVIRLGATTLGTTVVGADGKWTVAISPAQGDGTLLTATASDALGNTSAFDVIRVDAIAPPQPTIQLTNGTLLNGTAEAGSTVVLSVGGVQIGTAQVGGNGTWTFTASPPLADGVTVDVIARDASGNTSPLASTVVDATPPPVPIVNPSNGTVLSGTAETGATVAILVNGVEVGSTIAVNGSWNIAPLSLPHGTVVSVVTRDALGNTSAPATVTVDAVPPADPTISVGNGTLLSGTAEAGAIVTLTDGLGSPIAQVQANASGIWSYTVPGAPLTHNTVVRVVTHDAAGNPSNTVTATVDRQAPTVPTGQVNADGTLLTGTAEAGSTVRITIPGNSTPILVTATNGTYSVVLAPALIAGQIVSVTATDAAGNTSNPAAVFAPNLAPPAVGVAEAADSWINAAELTNGIQVQIGLQPGVRTGDTVTLTYRGVNGFLFTNVHTVTAAEVLAGAFNTTLVPPGGNGSYPQGAGSVTAHVNGGVDSAPVNFVVDTIAPTTPVLSLAGSLLTISADPGVAVTITVNIGGVTATQTVQANNAGLVSLNLLTALNVGLTWDQLLSAQISVSARDAAGNPSSLANIGLGVGTNLQPITLSNLAVDANLSLGGAKLGITGTTNANASLSIEVISPLLNVTLAPILANASGQFSLNLLSPSVLSQLGLTLGGLLNLGPDLQLRITTTSGGKQSATYVIDLDPLGLLGLTIGAITVIGTAADDIMSGTATAAERILTGGGNDLILNIGSGDRVETGTGNDTIQIKASNFFSIDGGSGFDTLLLDGGIDINFTAPGVGTVTNIERLDLGTGDSGSVVTLTSAKVDEMTDANNVLQITGDSNDVLRVIGAVNTNITQSFDGIRYNVYTFGSNLLYVEENTVQVIV